MNAADVRIVHACAVVAQIQSTMARTRPRPPEVSPTDWNPILQSAIDNAVLVYCAELAADTK